jgi:uncharacterized membrane protein
MIEFTHRPDWRWLSLGAVLLILLLLWSYRTARGARTNGRRPLWLVFLRFLTVSAIVVCLLDPQRVEAIRHQQKTRIAVVLDASRSMGLTDVSAGRLQAARNWLQQKLVPALPPNLSLSLYAFSDSLTSLADLEMASPTGGVTALSDALEALLSAPHEHRLAAVILCSDGIENGGKNPEAVARFYHRKGIPIHTATFGTTNEMQDIVLDNLQVKRSALNDAPTRIGVTLRSPGYAGRTVPLLIRRGKAVLAQTQVDLTGGSQRVDLDFTPREKGFVVYEAVVPPQRGEWRAGNNRRLFGLEVIDPTIRVLYMEGTPRQGSNPKPEWEYLQDALQTDPNIKVTVLNEDIFPGAGSETSAETGERVFPVNHPIRGYPHTLKDLLAYDVIINSDIRKEFFTDYQLQNTVRLVEQYGGGFVMIGGWSAFGAGGYQRTVIDRITPVAMEQLVDYHSRTFHLRVTPEALRHPVMAIGTTPEQTEQIWTAKFPLLYGCNRVDRGKPGAVVLGEDPTPDAAHSSNVILAVQELGKGRTMAFTSDTTRGWGDAFETIWGEPIDPSQPLSERNCDARYYRRFWLNAVRWLAAGRMNRTNNPVALELARSYCVPGEAISATVRLDSPDPKDVSAAEVSLFVSNANKATFTARGRYDEAGRCWFASLRPPGPGDYTITATASARGKRLGDDRQLLFCEDGDLEMAEVRANPALMAAIASASGGRVLSPDSEDSTAVVSGLAESAPVTVEYRRDPLWDKAGWLTLIVALLTLEWVLRRLRGLA